MSHRDVRKYFFSLRVIRKFNNLENEVVEPGSICSFKMRHKTALGAGREWT